MLSFIRSLGFFTAIIIILTACNSDEESATLLVRAELPLEVLLGDFEKDIEVRAEVTGADIVKSTDKYLINTPFNSEHRAASSLYYSGGTIEVPTGFDRTITLRAYQDGIETYRGSIVTDVLPGNNPTVRISLISLTDPAALKPKTIEATIGSGAVVVTPRSVMCPINGWRQLKAEIQNELGVKDDDIEVGDITWESSDLFVASVTNTGLVTITGSGEALITATWGNQEGTVMVRGAEPGIRDITFFMTADPQYRLGDDHADNMGWSGRNQKQMLNEMNALPGKPDEFCNLGVARPRGVLVAGDLTQRGHENEYDTFLAQWGLSNSPKRPNGKLEFRVFEGYGNHDDVAGEGNRGNATNPLGGRVFYDYYCGALPLIFSDEVAEKCTSPIINKVRERNQVRKTWVGNGLEGFWSDNYTVEGPEGGSDRWSGGLHYSWRWDDVHFVNLNLYGGKRYYNRDANQPTYARNSLRFLKNDLEKRVGDSGRPVVIMQHYGFDAKSNGIIGWFCDERSELAEVTADYNIIAFFTGHTPVRLERSVSHDSVIDYTSGAAREPAPGGDYRGGFLVVRLIGNQFHIQLRRKTPSGWIWGGGESWELPMPKFTPSESIDCK